MVMEESWKMENFTNFAPELYQICMCFATTKKLSIDVESPPFPTFSAKRLKCHIGKRDGHGKLRKLVKLWKIFVGILTIQPKICSRFQSTGGCIP